MIDEGLSRQRWDRRTVVRVASVAAIAAAWSEVGAQRVDKAPSDLQPGEFIWKPEIAPDGAVAIIASIPEQRVHVYRGGVRFAVSTCSTGKHGHDTPTGVFTILQKDKHHHSSTYNNAPMPNMNRLTWSGIALHAGQLPGYPASHGCVRLPMAFSELLFGVTHVGTAVIIAGGASDPREIVHPGVALGAFAERELASAVEHLKTKSLPAIEHASNPTPQTDVVVSSADRRMFVLENGAVVAEGEVTIRDPDKPLGSHVFVLAGGAGQGLTWHAIGFTHAAVGAGDPDASTLYRIEASTAVYQAMRARMHPGMKIVTTDLSAHHQTRSGRDFVVINQDEA